MFEVGESVFFSKEAFPQFKEHFKEKYPSMGKFMSYSTNIHQIILQPHPQIGFVKDDEVKYILTVEISVQVDKKYRVLNEFYVINHAGVVRADDY